jgi:hypothetical protein
MMSVALSAGRCPLGYGWLYGLRGICQLCQPGFFSDFALASGAIADGFS